MKERAGPVQHPWVLGRGREGDLIGALAPICLRTLFNLLANKKLCPDTPLGKRPNSLRLSPRSLDSRCSGVRPSRRESQSKTGRNMFTGPRGLGCGGGGSGGILVWGRGSSGLSGRR